MIPKAEANSSPGDIVECLRERLISWLTGVQSLEGSFKLHTVDPDNKVQSVLHSPSDFPKTLAEVKDFFKGARPIPRGGKAFMKIKASFNSTPKILSNGTDWYHKAKNELFKVSDLQSCHNDNIGWLLYSLNSMDLHRLGDVLENKVGAPIALRWRRINDGSPWVANQDTRNDPRAIHIESSVKDTPHVEAVLKELYRTKAKKFPLHVRMRFVPSVTKLLDVDSVGKFKVLANRQAGWVRQHMARSRDDIVEIDRTSNISNLTLRDMIMEITAHDNRPLFCSIDLKWTGTGYVFSFHPNKQVEATTTLRGLFPRLAHHYGEEAIVSFFTPLGVKEGRRMKYDPVTNTVTSEADAIIDDIAEADPDMVITEVLLNKQLEGTRSEVFEKERDADDSVSTFNSKRSHPTEINTTSKKQKPNELATMDSKDDISSTSSISTKQTLDTRITSLESGMEGMEKRIESKIDKKFDEILQYMRSATKNPGRCWIQRF